MVVLPLGLTGVPVTMELNQDNENAPILFLCSAGRTVMVKNLKSIPVWSMVAYLNGQNGELVIMERNLSPEPALILVRKMVVLNALAP